jgi:MFS transporter, AAHS family, 4-hydroxybenzoate transporter
MGTAGADVIDLTEIIEQQKFSKFILRLIAVSVLVTFFDGYDMQGIGYVAPYLGSAFHLNKLMMGNLFSIGLIGNVFGGFLIGGIGDHFGRRPAIIWSTFAFGILTCALGLARNYEQFLLLRFFDGVAIGGMLPVCWALNIEYAPKRYRSTIVTIVMAGYSIGASSAGPITVWLVPRFGWPSAFLFGGIFSLLAAALLSLTLPESIRFLSKTGRKKNVIEQVVRQLAPHRAVSPATQFILADEMEDTSRRGSKLAALFQGQLRWITPLLWIAYAVSSMAVYFGATWGPIVFESLGFTRSTSAFASSINTLGGLLGGLLLMRLTDRFGAISVGIMPFLAIPFLLVCGLATVQPSMFLVLVFLASVAYIGAHFGLISIAGIFYPSDYRSTGAGWAATISKLGSIAGPLAGGIILSSSLAVRSTYAILAICPAVVGLCAVTLGLLHMRMLRGDPRAPSSKIHATPTTLLEGRQR